MRSLIAFRAGIVHKAAKWYRIQYHLEEKWPSLRLKPARISFR